MADHCPHMAAEANMIKPGTVLVAHPDLDDDFFAFSLVLISEDHSGGTLGFALNKSSRFDLREAIDCPDWPYNDLLYNGGPVNKTALILIHSSEWYSSNTMPLNTDLSISSDTLMAEKMSMGNTPGQYRFVTGMSGWDRGQLQAEIDRSKWLTIPATDDIVFGNDGETQWRQAVEKYAQLAVSQYF